MSEKIKLKVPTEPEFEIVGQGNFSAELKPNSTIEVDNRNFAEWLILRHGLKEIKPRRKTDQTQEEDSLGYPAEFPGRAALIAAQIPHETTLGLTAEQLAAIPGIGAETAAQIVSITAVPSPVVESVEETADDTDGNGDQGGNSVEETADDTDGNGDQGGNEENGGAD